MVFEYIKNISLIFSVFFMIFSWFFESIFSIPLLPHNPGKPIHFGLHRGVWVKRGSTVVLLLVVANYQLRTSTRRNAKPFRTPDGIIQVLSFKFWAISVPIALQFRSIMMRLTTLQGTSYIEVPFNAVLTSYKDGKESTIASSYALRVSIEQILPPSLRNSKKKSIVSWLCSSSSLAWRRRTTSV